MQEESVMESPQHQSHPGRRLIPGNRVQALWGVALLLMAWPMAVLAEQDEASTPSHAILVQEEIPEDLLIDVGVQVFDPGLSLYDKTEWEKKRIYSEVRRSEARYLPINLMSTLQATGQWGAVRVVPLGVESMDLAVAGQIIESSGKELVVDIRAVDVTGRLWLEKRFKERVEQDVYEQENGQLVQEPFQGLYNRIANELLAARKKFSDEELRRVRQVNQLKFAAGLAPYVFEDYLGYDKKGRLVVERLPASEDPMIERVSRIRERDDLFIDTLSEHYAEFAHDMTEAYDNWRMFSYEEQVMYEKLRRKARARKILGIASIIGGVILSGETDDPRVGDAVANAGVFGGVVAISSGIAKSQEAKFHAESLSELAASFDSEIEPLLVDVEGQTLRLQGSIETQYATWRQLLRDIFVSETGMPIDPDSGDVAVAVIADSSPEAGGADGAAEGTEPPTETPAEAPVDVAEAEEPPASEAEDVDDPITAPEPAEDVEADASEPQPVETQPVETQPVEPQPVETQPVETQLETEVAPAQPDEEH